jgi:hypothetical protein
MSNCPGLLESEMPAASHPGYVVARLFASRAEQVTRPTPAGAGHRICADFAFFSEGVA